MTTAQALAENVAAFRSNANTTFSLNLSVDLIGTPNRPLRIDSVSGDGLTVADAAFPALQCINRPDGTAAKKVRYFAYFADQRHRVFAEGREAIVLRPGEMVFLSTCEPWKLHFTKPYRLTTLAIDRDLFSDYMPEHERLIGRRLDDPFHLQKSLSSLLHSAQAISQAGRFAEAGPCLMRAFLNTMSLLRYEDADESQAPLTPTTLSRRCAQVKSIIDQQYARPDLSVTSIAKHLQLSLRYLQMAFAAEGLSPAEYLRQRRLHEGAKLLRDPRSRSLSITELAYSCGFNTSSHFATQFRRAFGMPPRDYRQIAESGDLGCGEQTPAQFG